MSGKKYSQGKPKLSLIDPDFSTTMAQVLMMGEEKYGEANWMQGIRWSEMVDSAKRHLAAIEKGDFFDVESGKFHGAHIACCMMMLNHYIQNDYYDNFDDLRYSNHGCSLWPSFDESEEWQLQVESQSSNATESNGEAPQTLDNALQRINSWAHRVIPHRTAEKALMKLMLEELPELLLSENRSDPMEWADVLILALDGAQLSGVDPVKAIHQKMAINENRAWTTNDLGVSQHVK
jgi:hypothetical protein